MNTHKLYKEFEMKYLIITPLERFIDSLPGQSADEMVLIANWVDSIDRGWITKPFVLTQILFLMDHSIQRMRYSL